MSQPVEYWYGCVCEPVLYMSSVLYQSMSCTNMYSGFRTGVCCSSISMSLITIFDLK